MHGHGYAPPPPRRPSTGVVVTLRVIFVALPLMTCGFIAWAATLRAALVTRRKRDWGAFGGSLVVWAFAFALMSTDTTEDLSSPNGTLGLILLLLNAIACAAYYLTVDIRHYGQPLFMADVPPQQTTVGYGYQQAPPAPQPYAGTPVPQPPAPQAAPVPPPPQRPAPVRIDQVRAELDELSDYLRKHEDGR